MSELLDLGPRVKFHGSVEGNALATVINTQNVYEPINANLTPHPKNLGFTVSGCVVTRTGIENDYEVEVTISGQKDGPGANEYAVKFHKNGTQALVGRNKHEYSKSGVEAGLYLPGVVNLKDGETIEPKLTSTTGDDDFIAVDIHMTLREWI